MSGFSPSLMTGLMQANTALMTAQQHTNAISHMDAQKQTLEAEIKSGNGDIEGKQAEIERIDAQREKTEAMQQDAMNQANASIGNAVVDESKETDNKNINAADKDDNADKTKDDSEKVSKKAADTASELRKENSAHNIAAVDYEDGMHIAENGKTNIAVSPEFLEKMADNKDLHADYAKKFDTMAKLSVKDAASNVVSHTWAVDKGGSVRHYSTLTADTDAEQVRMHREAMYAQGREAFGDAFAGAFVRAEAQQPADHTSAVAIEKASTVSTGIMIDLSL